MGSIEYIDRWKKENVVKYSFYANKNTEADVVEWLKTIPNRRQYLISLIRKDMNELSTKTTEDRKKE